MNIHNFVTLQTHRIAHTVRNLLAFAVTATLIAGCSSDGSGSGHSSYRTYSSGSFYAGSSWYDYPYYWYDNPSYIVVEPIRPSRPDRPDGKPTHPIEPVPGEPRPHLTPSQADNYRDRRQSRMPQNQPRMSNRATRPSIPSWPRGGFGGGGLRRR